MVLAREGVSAEDAQRWADEGCHVFVVAALAERWGVNHVNSGQVYGYGAGAESPAELLAIEKKEG
jgi:hypothetical protein